MLKLKKLVLRVLYIVPVNNLSIRNKLLLSYLLVVLVPVLIVGLILTNSMRKNSIDMAVKESVINVEKIKKNLEDILKTPAMLSSKIYTDKKFCDFISKEYKTPLDIFEAYNENQEFRNYTGLYREIGYMKFYAYNKTIVNNGEFDSISDKIMQTWWYQQCIEFRGKTAWNYISSDNSSSNYFNLIRLVKSIAGTPLGVLTIGINQNYLNDIVEQEQFDTMIIDDRGYIIASKNKSEVGSEIANINMSIPLQAIDNGIFEAEYNNKKSKIIVNSFTPADSKSSIKIISCFRIESIIKDANRASMLGYLVIAGSLLLALCLILLFANMISIRLRNLSKQIHKLSLGNFDAECNIPGNDEIGNLSKDFNTMVKSLKQLVHEVYEVNIQKSNLLIQQKDIKFRMLANQINPHFLFNSLETIRMQAHCNGQKEISDIIKLLGKLIRRNLETGTEPIALCDELDMVKGYLEIQKFRFRERLDYNISIDNTLWQQKILPLIIQPIVENAVVHGLESKVDNGIININIYVENTAVHVTVKDNGVGINEADLKKIFMYMDMPEDTPGKKIGLRNIHQRIKHYYGENFGVAVSSHLNTGTVVDITIPLDDTNNKSRGNYSAESYFYR